MSERLAKVQVRELSLIVVKMLSMTDMSLSVEVDIPHSPIKTGRLESRPLSYTNTKFYLNITLYK